jgi:hypothetical protein
MTEKDALKKIQLLKRIEPNKDWAVLTKRRLLGDFREPGLAEQILEIFQAWPNLSWQYKPALASVVFASILVGTFSLAQSSLPGNLLYPVKKLTEKIESVFIAKAELPRTRLELAGRRLNELAEIAQSNQVKNLASAINEFQASQLEAAKNIADSQSLKLTKEIVQATEKIEREREKIEALGVDVGETKELNEALSQWAEREIKDLEGRTLSESQQELLAQAKADYEEGNFSQALEVILQLTYPQE